jgi:hypothetical protein
LRILFLPIGWCCTLPTKASISLYTLSERAGVNKKSEWDKFLKVAAQTIVVAETGHYDTPGRVDLSTLTMPHHTMSTILAGTS